MKKPKLFIINLACFVCITLTMILAPLTGKLLTALSYIIHYFVYGLVWLVCQPVRLMAGGKRLNLWWKEPIPTYYWSPTPPEA